VTKEEILEFIDSEYGDEEIILADGFEDAFIGIAVQFNTYLATYDYDTCLNILMERDGMEHMDAVEYFDFNVTGAYVGKATPIFLTRITGG